jgi:hypothetical protein
MHGLVLTSLQRYLTEKGVSRVPGTYADDASYHDRELDVLLDHAGEHVPETREELLHDFGRYLGLEAFPRMAPEFYAHHETFQSCLLAVEQQIHVVVRTALAGASPPQLRVSPLGERGVVVAYLSKRRLCALLEGLVEATAERYATPVEITHPQCTHRGDPWCSLVVQANGAAR